MGLGVRPVQTRMLLTEGLDHAAIAQQYYEPPLINIIKFACNACEDNVYRVERGVCQGCLAHPCREICPKGAITVTNNLAVIDYSKCDNCGLCATVCPKKLIKDSNVENLPDPNVVVSMNGPAIK